VERRGACTSVSIIARFGGVALLAKASRRSPLAFVPVLVAGARHEGHEESHGEEDGEMAMVAAEEGSFICRGSVNGPGVKLADDNAEQGPAREWAPTILRAAESARARRLTPT